MIRLIVAVIVIIAVIALALYRRRDRPNE